jgi:hypothetical protein
MVRVPLGDAGPCLKETKVGGKMEPLTSWGGPSCCWRHGLIGIQRPGDLHGWKRNPRMSRGQAWSQKLAIATWHAFAFGSRPNAQGFCLASGRWTRDMIGFAGSCALHGLACDLDWESKTWQITDLSHPRPELLIGSIVPNPTIKRARIGPIILPMSC